MMPRASLDTAILRAEMGEGFELILGATFKVKEPLATALATALQTTNIREARVTVRARQSESS